jgi:hypothetical protein
MVKAPSSEWQYFTDAEDKRMLIGMLLPGSEAEIRIYYDNNQLNQEAEAYMKAYMKLLARHEDVKGPRKTQLGGLDAFMLRYTDDGEDSNGVSVRLSNGSVVVVSKTKKKKKKKEKRFDGPRDVHEYKMVQIDGVASIRCSAPKGERKKYQKMFEQVRASFVLDLTRRW